MEYTLPLNNKERYILNILNSLEEEKEIRSLKYVEEYMLILPKDKFYVIGYVTPKTLNKWGINLEIEGNYYVCIYNGKILYLVGLKKIFLICFIKLKFFIP